MDTLTRRHWLGATLAAGVGLVVGPRARAAEAALQERAVSGVSRVVWEIAGEIQIEQADQERLTVQAEPAVLAKLVTESRQGELRIAFRPGRVVSETPIRLHLQLKSLSSLQGQGAGRIAIGALQVPELSVQLGGTDVVRLASLRARSLDVRLEGAGGMQVDGGQVQRQRIVITGAADYTAPALASREADATIEGSGQVRLAVSERLDARIDGSGDVLFRGEPRIARTVNGAGSVRRDVSAR